MQNKLIKYYIKESKIFQFESGCGTLVDTELFEMHHRQHHNIAMIFVFSFFLSVFSILIFFFWFSIQTLECLIRDKHKHSHMNKRTHLLKFMFSRICTYCFYFLIHKTLYRFHLLLYFLLLLYFSVVVGLVLKKKLSIYSLRSKS